jgi:hypothetical protein
MIEAGLKAGDIFTWQNYPYFFKEFKPQRWLLYLGNNSIEAIVYQISTTTQYQHYNFELIPEADLNRCKADITKKGSLSQDYINKFVKHLKADRYIQTIAKKDIYRYLRDAGFRVTL